MDGLRVMLYARVSSAVQKRRRDADRDEPSLGQQITEMEKEAGRRGWHVVARCEDVLTGSIPVRDRPGGAQIYEKAAADAFDVLVVYDNDRVGRDQDGVVAKVFRADLRFMRKQVFSVHQPLDPKRPDEYEPYEDDSSLWLESVSDTASSIAIRQFRRRRAFGMLKRVEEKKLMPGKLPIGYAAERHVLPNGRVLLGHRVADPEFGPIIRRIFNEYEGGASAQTIAVILNRDGLRTPAGNHWTAGTIHGLIENPVYYGAVAYLKHKCDGPPHPHYPRRRISRNQPKDRWLIVDDAQHPALISKEQWQRCQSIRRKRSTAGRTFGESTLLSGLLECGRCGSPLNRSGSDYWVCSLARKTARAECDPGAMRVSVIEESVLQYLARLARDPALVQQLVLTPVSDPEPRAEQAISALSTQISQAEARLVKAREAYEAGVDSLVVFAQRKAELEDQLNSLSERCAKLKASRMTRAEEHRTVTSIMAVLQDLPSRFRSRPLRTQKAILRTFVERIVVNEGGLHIRFRTGSAAISGYDGIMLMIQSQSEHA